MFLSFPVGLQIPMAELKTKTETLSLKYSASKRVALKSPVFQEILPTDLCITVGNRCMQMDTGAFQLCHF